ATPHGNTLTTEFSKAAILGEKLGMDSITDFLAVSYSTPDMIGHAYGPNSVEVEDCYLRLDKELGAFFDFLDQHVGKGQYLVFLSADHGAAHVPGFMKENKLSAGFIDDQKLNDRLNAELKTQFGVDNLSLGLVNFQVVLNIPAIDRAKNVREADVSARAISWLEKQEGILRAFRLDALKQTTLPKTLSDRVANGYYPARNGHIQVVFKPGYLEGFLTGGTTHGVWYPYDAHIPLLWYGWKIPAGNSHRTVSMADIAPTIAALLNIQEPNGSIGNVIQEIIK
ncbi:MAG TPA: alkaline phosphatase family protein, partial [Phnomibacter sp.]|nr:alkaline phosphatase family protein [Phnomibacter sp.]